MSFYKWYLSQLGMYGQFLTGWCMEQQRILKWGR